METDGPGPGRMAQWVRFGIRPRPPPGTVGRFRQISFRRHTKTFQEIVGERGFEPPTRGPEGESSWRDQEQQCRLQGKLIPLGRAVVAIVGAIAEQERSLVVERYAPGFAAPGSKAVQAGCNNRFRTPAPHCQIAPGVAPATVDDNSLRVREPTT